MLSDGEKKAIKDCDEIFIHLDAMMSEESANDYRISYLTLTNLIEKQSKEIEQTKYIKRNFDYCIAVEKKKLEDKIKAIIEERNKWLQEYDEQEEMNELQKDDYRLIKAERYILQSLLEKEQKK